MSQPQKGKKPPAKEGRSRGPKNASGSSGDKKGAEAVEKKSESTSPAESPKTQTSGASSISKALSSSTVASKTPTMKPSETKASSSQPKASGVESHKRKRNKKQAAQKAKAEAEKAAQLAKSDGSQTKHPSEEKQKEPGGAKIQSKPSAVEPKQPSTGKVPSGQIDKSATQLTSKEEPKAKPDDKPSATKAAVAAAGTAGAAAAAAGLTVAAAETKESKLPATTPAAAESKSAEKSDIDAALDDLIDTLGGPAENEPPTPEYTGPAVSDPMSSLYIEELGKRESTIPPEYRKLLEGKGDDKAVPQTVAVGESQPTMTDDDLADALSSDFTCSAVTSAGEKKDMPKEQPAEGELQAQSASLISSSAPPKEKKARVEEAVLSDNALDALVDTLGMPEPEPEVDLSSIVEVEEPKAKERKEKKPGEDDDTIPPEYRLKPALDKDGKPLLPKPEEKPKPLSDSELVDEFSKDFACPTPPAEISKPSKPADVPEKPKAAEPPKTPKENVAASPAVPSVQPSAPSGVSTKPSVAEPKQISTEEVVSVAAAPSVASSAPSATSPTSQVPDEALEALSGSLGKVEPHPEEKKPAVDKVKEKAKQEEREKLGEDEETIPPDYRLTEAKDKDGKPLLPKPQEKPQPLSESELIDALSEGFSCSSAPKSKADPTAALQKSTGAGKPAVAPTEEVISSASASAVHSAGPPPAATPGRKELDDAADLLADSLGQREPDPDENKPLVDKIKEKAKSEHRDKLGERDDTIPPDYRHILDSDEKGKPTGKDAEKSKEQKKPADDSAAIDALSGDFDKCGKPPVSQPSTKDEKTKDAATSKPGRKDEKKSKSSKKAKEQSSSSAKSEKQKKS